MTSLSSRGILLVPAAAVFSAGLLFAGHGLIRKPVDRTSRHYGSVVARGCAASSACLCARQRLPDKLPDRLRHIRDRPLFRAPFFHVVDHRLIEADNLLHRIELGSWHKRTFACLLWKPYISHILNKQRRSEAEIFAPTCSSRLVNVVRCSSSSQTFLFSRSRGNLTLSFAKLPALRFLSRTSPIPPWIGEEAIREELFSVERLEQHAASLAAAQSISSQPEKGRPLAKRVRDNDEALLAAYRVIAAAIADKFPITPAAEWLVDNFHLAEDQIREIRTNLPPSYYRQLPKLAEGPFQGYPRIFEIAWAFVAHTDSRFEANMLQRFVATYQRVQPLTIGELWALAITIRVVLVENLRRLSDLIVGSQTSRDAANALADCLLQVGTKSFGAGRATFAAVCRHTPYAIICRPTRATPA